MPCFFLYFIEMPSLLSSVCILDVMAFLKSFCLFFLLISMVNSTYHFNELYVKFHQQRMPHLQIVYSNSSISCSRHPILSMSQLPWGLLNVDIYQILWKRAKYRIHKCKRLNIQISVCDLKGLFSLQMVNCLLAIRVMNCP